MHTQQDSFPSRWQVELQSVLGHGKIKVIQLAAEFHILHVVGARKVPRDGWCSDQFLTTVWLLGDAGRSSLAAEADGRGGCSPLCRIHL